MLKDWSNILDFAENDDNLEGSVEKTDKELTKPKFQAICNGIQGDTENSCQSDKMVAADTSTESDSQSPVLNGKLKGEKRDLTLPNIPSTTEKSMLPEDQDQHKKSELHNNVMSSDDPINEFLNRSDTAVIYPEPVSDQEEDDNSHSDSVGPPEEELILRCINCSDGFTRASLLRDHMHAHHPNQPVKYLCPKCDETFILKTHLDKHLALHSPTSQVCRVCNKTFANVYRLQRHMISHDESNDLRKFKCPECGKAFKFKHHLKEHIRIHSGEKPFECPNCGKRFSHSGSYSSHMTSKKCWVVGANKNRPIDRTGDTEPNLAYTAGRTPVSVMDSPLQSPPPGSYPQYLPFDPRKTAIPAYYSPPTSNIHNYVSPYIYPVRHNVASSMIPIVSSQSLTESLRRPIFTQSPFRKEPATQISPDVNSNTELLSIQGLNSSTPIKIPASPKIPATSENSAKRGSLNDSDKEREAFSDGFPCRYCGSGFQSPIDQHQHERYLCKLNKDITPLISRSDSARNSPNSEASEISRHDIMNGSLSTGTDDEDEIDDSGKDDNNSGENKKLRERSLISDEQLQILKTYYQLNPRPRKFELIRIGNEIGFPKRVVQVWFQNMRARDRKKGKDVPYFPSMARFKIQEDSSINWKDGKTKPNYIPVVPQPYAHQPKLNGQFIPCLTPPSRSNSVATSEESDQPLDLSIKKLPPRAHSSNGSFSTTPPKTLDEQVLNLSVRSDTVVEMKSRPEGSLQDSAIYKYMQQEGLFFHPQFIQNPRLLPSQNFPNAFVSHSSPKTSLPMPIVVKSEIKSESPKVKSEPVVDQVNSKCCSDTQSSRADSDIADTGRLVIDESEHVDDQEKDAESQNGRIMLENIKPKIEQYLDLGNMAKATENLATLAEVSLAAHAAVAALTSSKPKRLRKKSWRQMESEEIELELDESCSIDDDEPLRKKRKSWKGHRLDVDDGLYSCDQCDKLFSKQSSLARHKYEHSGARPFQCEICTKAFKHKHHLTEHRRLHTGDKPFQCKKCGKRFSHSGSYSQHMNHRYKYCKPMKGEGETETDSSHDECTSSKTSLFEG